MSARLQLGFARALLLILLLCPAVGYAHKQSDSYLTLAVAVGESAVRGRWDIALRDLDFVVGLDANADAAITWGEVKAQRRAIEAYAVQRLLITGMSSDADSVCSIAVQDLLIDSHVDGAYAVLRFVAACRTPPDGIGIEYGLLFAVDPNHRGLLDVRTGRLHQTVVLSMQTPTVTIDMHRKNLPQQLTSFIREGIWHIWQGYDHILFLLTLLLPAVLTHRAGAWQPRSFRDSAADIVKVVSAFTAAHSVTLSLAAIGVVQLPSRIVETTIALTVLLGALNILFLVVHARRWLVALSFGLVHGLGFASVLADLQLPSNGLLLSLIGFNVGVEIGQLAIVTALMPFAFVIRKTTLYRRALLPMGAATISALAVYWIGIRWTG